MLTALLASLTLYSYAPPAPRANLAPNPNYNQICADVGVSAPACAEAALEALDTAHAHENLGPLMLPHNWSSLTAAEQIFVITNLERVARGETPITGLTAPLNAVAEAGAVQRTDPRLPGLSAPFVSIWAEDPGPLASDYGWMYQDGYGGPGNTPNLACTSTAATGCWGHRDNILAEWSRRLLAGHPGSWYLAAGAAQTIVPGGLGSGTTLSDAMIVTAATTPPTYAYTWAQAVAEGAGEPGGLKTIPGTIDGLSTIATVTAWLRTHAFPLAIVISAAILLRMQIRAMRRRARWRKTHANVQDIRRFRR